MQRSLGWWVLGVIACSASPEVAPPPPPVDAGVDAAPRALSELASLTEIAVYQVVKVDVMRDGADIVYANAPIVPKRSGIVRAYVSVVPKAWRARKLKAEMHLFLPQGEVVIADERLIAATSDDDSLDSTFVFPFPATTFTKTGSVPYYVLVSDPKLAASGDEVATLRYPAGLDTGLIHVDKSPGSVKLHVVPFEYDADGSKRVPLTQAPQLTAIANQMMDLYPASSVTLDVGPVVPWSEPINADGTGWDAVLEATLNQRAADGPTSEVYYVGLFSPSASFGQYCKGGCVLGLAPLADPTNADARGAAVVGFGGYETTETVAHEIGHTMGRAHAPCGGPAGVDPKFPYPDGSIGVSGFRTSDQALIGSAAADMMSYCPPEWVSDYTYKALFTRMSYVNTHIQLTPAPLVHITRIRVDGDGNIVGASAGVAREQDSGAPISVRFSGSRGADVVGRMVRYDHLPGGYIIAPEAPAGATHVSVPSLPGRPWKLAR